MAETGNQPLEGLMTLGRTAQTATLIVITPTTNPAWVAITGLRNHKNRMTTLLVDPSDFGSPRDQGKVVNALAQSRIPFVSVPGSLLREAYPSLHWGDKKPSTGFQTRKRYLQQGQTTWRQMG